MFFEAFPILRHYANTFRVISHRKQAKVEQIMLRILLVEINSFLSYIFPVLEFLNFLAMRVEFLISSFFLKKIRVFQEVFPR